MSRIGRMPIPLPAGVSTQEKGHRVTVTGPRGTLELGLRPEIDVEIAEGSLMVKPNGSGAQREARAYHGMTRSLLNNMVEGVSRGFSKTLEIIGVGWNAQAKGGQLTLNVGFCHPVVFEIPSGLEVTTPKQTTIEIVGADKQAVGQLAANVRKVRPPEPYKGKGIRYKDEFVRRKAGKSFGS